MSENGNKSESLTLQPTEADKRFFKFIAGWAQRYLQTRGKRIVLGLDFYIDFQLNAIHPITNKGRDFVMFVKGEFPRLIQNKRIERLG